MASRLDWARDGADWPNRAASRFVTSGGVRWHVQIAGSGPVLLLLHGTGASTHSWRDLFPLLTPHFTVVAPDLPGHAFSPAFSGEKLSLPGMARAVRSLLASFSLRPDLVAGHSAGAAVAARMALDGAIAPRVLFALNGAFLPPRGLPGQIFPPVARLLAQMPLASQIFSWRASDPSVMARLLRETGSKIDPLGTALYTRLGRSPGHVEGALTMMARWDLAPLVRDLPRLATPLVLVVGSNDRTIAPSQSETLRRVVPCSRLIRLPGLGHLAHEERPDLVATEIRGLWHPEQMAGCRAPSLA